MSIYATIFDCSGDLDPNPEEGEFPPAIAYLHSAAIPNPEQRTETVQLACIPDHITEGRGGAASKCPFVRLSVNDEDVVLDRKQVDGMISALSWWVKQQDGPLET